VVLGEASPTALCSGFSYETAPGRFVTGELFTDDLQSRRAPEARINGFAGYSRAARPRLTAASHSEERLEATRQPRQVWLARQKRRYPSSPRALLCGPELQ